MKDFGTEVFTWNMEGGDIMSASDGAPRSVESRGLFPRDQSSQV